MTANQNQEAQLTQIEERLSNIESKLGLTKVASKPANLTPTNNETTREEEKVSSVTSILGWSGASALVLAAVYLIRLAIDSGWLTPERQVGLAVLGGLILIGAGLALRHVNRHYAALLPAGGIVTLFLSIYGAHAYYGLVSPQAAATCIVMVCALSLWLEGVLNFV